VYNGEALTSTIASFRALDYKWWAFTAIAVGMFGTLVDQTSVNLALPRIADHFDSTIPAVQWIALGYILVTGSLLLPMGRLSDMIGRRRVYTAGFVIFIAGAALTGSAPSLFGLILFKLFQGIGAAMIQANAMAIMTSAFPGRERGKAIGLFMMIVGLGAIVGPTVGGALVGLLGWRAVFFMGVPFWNCFDCRRNANPARRISPDFEWQDASAQVRLAWGAAVCGDAGNLFAGHD
jgi:MFS family permease